MWRNANSERWTSGGRGEVGVDAVVEAGEVHGFFEHLPGATERLVEGDLEADEGGEDDAGVAEGGEDLRMGLEGEVVGALGGFEEAGEEDAQEVDLAGEVVDGGGVEHGAFVGGEVTAIEGGVRGRFVHVLNI